MRRRRRSRCCSLRSHSAPAAKAQAAELSIVFTDDAGMRRTQQQMARKGHADQRVVVSADGGRLLGDVILSAETIAREAALADKPLEDHMAHLIIHGYLHLLGYDHEAEDEAEKMEQLERVALKALGISDPYAPASRQ